MGDSFEGTIIRKYQIQQYISSGNISRIYKAQDLENGRMVAVKVVLEDAVEDADDVRRMQMEAVIVFRLDHPNIVPLYDYWRDEIGIWIVTPWMPGGSLRDQFLQGGWPLPRTLHVVEQITSALQAAHKINIIHRDIKPDNILFDVDGNAYLADFGAAKRLKSEAITHPTVFVGSPAYLAPEQIQKEAITARTDVYALGVTLHETLAGQHPFIDATTKMKMILKHLNEPLPPLEQSRPDIPFEVAEVIAIATAKDPEQRYPDMASLAEAFIEAANA